MIGSWLLVAFGFGNLAMLGWLAAAAAPLLIHLWSRRHYREVPWAAVAFLLAAIRKNSRRIQLQQWLLLAVRTLIILLVVLAVAEPYGEELVGGIAGAPTHKVLVIDTSLSMAYRDEALGRLTRAKQLAAALVDQSGPGDAFTLITLADPPRRLVLRDGNDRGAVPADIEAVAQSHGRGDLAKALDLLAAALQLSPEQRQRLERQEVYFFTDLQRDTWLPDETANDAVGDRWAALAEQAALVVVDVGSPREANLAVTNLRIAAPFVPVGRDVAFDATLRQFGEQPVSDCVVELLVDNVPVGQQTVDVPAGSETTVRFAHRFRDAGSHAVTLRAASHRLDGDRLDGDRLDIDNTRWLTVDVQEQVQVLCVAGRPRDAKYIADALDPDPQDQSALRPRVVSEGEFADTDLAPFDCVFLSNVSQLTAGETGRLSRFVRQGRGLAIFLGDRVIADSYNAATLDDGTALLPMRLGDLVAEPRFGLDPLDYRHPIAAPFRGRERAGLLTTPVARYFRLVRPASPTRTEVALATAGGDPLIVTASLGSGRIVLVATAGSLASVDRATGEPWTAWPAWPSFLPVVREMLAFAVGGKQLASQATVGTPIWAAVPSDSAAQSIEITRPDGRTATTRVTTSLAGRRWSYDDTDVSGIYAARGMSRNNRINSNDARFAVNVDTRESDLAQVDRQKLPPELIVQSTTETSADSVGSILPRAAWQRSLLWTALALVFVELCLAWLFGRGGT